MNDLKDLFNKIEPDFYRTINGWQFPLIYTDSPQKGDICLINPVDNPRRKEHLYIWEGTEEPTENKVMCGYHKHNPGAKQTVYRHPKEGEFIVHGYLANTDDYSKAYEEVRKYIGRGF